VWQLPRISEYLNRNVMLLPNFLINLVNIFDVHDTFSLKIKNSVRYFATHWTIWTDQVFGFYTSKFFGIEIISAVASFGDSKVDICPYPILKAAQWAGARKFLINHYYRYIILTQKHAYIYRKILYCVSNKELLLQS